MKLKQIKRSMVGIVGLVLASSTIAGTNTLDVTVTGLVVGGCFFNQTSYNQNWGDVSGMTVAKASGDLEYFCSSGVAFEIKPDKDVISGDGFHIKYYKNGDYAEANRLTLTNQGVVGVGNGNLQTSTIFYKLESNDDTIDEGEGNILFKAGTIDGSVTYVITF